MEIGVRDVQGGFVVLDINGEIDLYNAPEIKSKVIDLTSEDKKNIIINLEDVSYIDSSGIGVLISSLASLRDAGGSLKIINVHDSVKKVFELTKLTGFFKIYPSEEDAINS